MIRRPVFLTSALALAAAPALADDVQSGIAACEAALEAAAAEAYPDARFQFQQTRGGGLKKMAFRMTWNEESGTARCHVRRGDVEEIVWPRKFADPGAPD